MPEQISLHLIKTNGGTQARAGIDMETVAEYGAVMHAAGGWGPFPPVDLYYDGDTYWLADGFHRISAYKKRVAIVGNVLANVHQGTRRDAVLHAVGANANHGRRRTNADKRRAVMTLLKDEEWQQWSDREIARRTLVSHPFVAKLRAEAAESSGNDYQMERKATRGGKTYTVNTANIGSQPTQTRPAASASPDDYAQWLDEQEAATAAEVETILAKDEPALAAPVSIPEAAKILLKWSEPQPRSTESIINGLANTDASGHHIYIDQATDATGLPEQTIRDAANYLLTTGQVAQPVAKSLVGKAAADLGAARNISYRLNRLMRELDLQNINQRKAYHKLTAAYDKVDEAIAALRKVAVGA